MSEGGRTPVACFACGDEHVRDGAVKKKLNLVKKQEGRFVSERRINCDGIKFFKQLLHGFKYTFIFLSLSFYLYIYMYIFYIQNIFFFR